MKFRQIFLTLFLSFLTNIIYGQGLPSNILFYPKISTTSAYAEGSLNNFAQHTAYKTLTTRADMPLIFFVRDNIYADINYFVRSDYNNNLGGGTEYTNKFSKANINYKTDTVWFKLGRQQYAPQGKEGVIYYGEYEDRDNILPSAVEGISHGADTAFFAYSAIAAKEVKNLSPSGDNSLVYGAQGAFKISRLFSIDAFYYARDTKNLNDISLAVYGTGFTFNLPESLLISFYAAFNNGNLAKQVRGVAMNSNYDGYSLNAKLEVNSQSEFAKNNYRFNIFYGSAAKNSNAAFTPISSNIDTGYVFGGMNLSNTNSFDGRTITRTAGNAQQAADIMAYSFNIRLMPLQAKGFALDFGVYNFISTSSTAAYKNIGNEADIKLRYKSGPLEARLMYGLFVSGNGLAQATASSAPSNKTINKIGLCASYEFSL